MMWRSAGFLRRIASRGGSEGGREISQTIAKEYMQSISDVCVQLTRLKLGAQTTISLGQNCSAAWYIKQTGLKEASYPFDWIFSSADIVLDAIDSDFCHFLDRDLIQSKGGKAGHRRYHSSLFNHKNPVSSPEAFSYYQRSVSRFRNLAGQDQVDFVTMILLDAEQRPDWLHGFPGGQFPSPSNQSWVDYTGVVLRLQDAVREPKFLFVLQDRPCHRPRMRFEMPEANIGVVHWRPFGPNNGVYFSHPTDDFAIKRVLATGYDGANA
ncbi:DUF1796 family putative cysteine peptidase [Frateuria hangzhouensis]|uniref:DUF1796 family putative cysteine peptidase n=1 Tax=Frateuria hangzhouensis TaxID=2995589 RepID=UPI0022608FB3|nr:DUF1796 family putative cysteine peptidase [Frateuria sp. STR12]MCX7515315.1 DUF1796 family putative cysteine peptidase [Frateuria sp. STR12]